MNTLREIGDRFNRFFNWITDWILIGIGLALIIKALVAVDVPTAKYLIVGVGLVLFIVGFWYRRRRKRRHR